MDIWRRSIGLIIMHSILSNQKFFITMYKIHGKCLIWIHNCNFSYAHYQNSSSFDKVRGRFCVGILNLKCIVYHRASLSKVENRAVVPVKIWEIPKRDSISFQKTYSIEKKKMWTKKKLIEYWDSNLIPTIQSSRFQKHTLKPIQF